MAVIPNPVNLTDHDILAARDQLKAQGARVLGQGLSASYGQQVIVDNRGGANGVIAAQIVAKSPPSNFVAPGPPGNNVSPLKSRPPPVATIVAGWEFAADWRLDTALRYAYSEGLEGWFSRWSPSVVLRMPVTERFEVHAEWFGSFTQGLVDDTSQPFFSPGMHVMVTRNLELGVRVGWGLTAEAAPFFSDAGLAIRY